MCNTCSSYHNLLFLCCPGIDDDGKLWFTCPVPVYWFKDRARGDSFHNVTGLCPIGPVKTGGGIGVENDDVVVVVVVNAAVHYQHYPVLVNSIWYYRCTISSPTWNVLSPAGCNACIWLCSTSMNLMHLILQYLQRKL